MLVHDTEWTALEAGLVQRAELLDAVLTDLYDRRRLIADGLLPPEVVFGHDGFVRAADQIRLPGAHQLFLAGVDLVRAATGEWAVLGDRTQAPSGAGYAMENRRVVSRLLPGLYRDSRIQRLAPFFHAMRLGLQEIAPAGAEAPHVVLLTPGAQSETAFDQSFLSSLLGYPLVVGSDLTVRGGRVWARTLGRLEPVDVILRRVDAAYVDPLELRPDSQLGVPGLLEAARRGTVSIVNGIGSGVVENRGLLPFLPAICARPCWTSRCSCPSVPTWWCGDPVSRAHVRANLERLVVKPIDRAAGPVLQLAQRLSAGERDRADGPDRGAAARLGGAGAARPEHRADGDRGRPRASSGGAPLVRRRPGRHLSGPDRRPHPGRRPRRRASSSPTTPARRPRTSGSWTAAPVRSSPPGAPRVRRRPGSSRRSPRARRATSSGWAAMPSGPRTRSGCCGRSATGPRTRPT